MSSSYNTTVRITVKITKRKKYCTVKGSREAKVRVGIIITETSSSKETRISNNREISSNKETFNNNEVIMTQTNSLNGPEQRL